MTTLTDRPGSALLVIDVQNGVVGGADRRGEVVAAIAGLVARARAEGVHVVWVRHHGEGLASGSPDWQIVPELVPADGEPVVEKAYGDAFEDTDPEAVLAERSVGRLVVTGAETDACIRSTLHGGFVRGYDAVLVGDAHTAGDKTAWGAPPVADVIAYTNLYWQYQTAAGRTAGTVSAADAELSTPA